MSRLTKFFPPGALHLMDRQGHCIQEFLRFKSHNLCDDDEVFFRERCPDWIWHIADVSNANPDHFSYDRWDERCLLKGGQNFSGVSLGDVADRTYVGNVKDCYNSVKTSFRSRISLEVIYRARNRSFLRAVYPLTFNGCKHKVLVACTYKDIDSIPYVSAAESAIARQKINATFTAGERAIAGVFNHQIHALKAVDAGREAELDYVFKGNANDPVAPTFKSDGLAISGKSPGKA